MSRDDSKGFLQEVTKHRQRTIALQFGGHPGRVSQKVSYLLVVKQSRPHTTCCQMTPVLLRPVGPARRQTRQERQQRFLLVALDSDAPATQGMEQTFVPHG
jgi:hypothetical protein